ncbi:uncharacterized protein LOC132195152 [Neocloeon triangulifer]|uniref:uncharacterized protein LOC132195152 n=1 Tax=Neocloeon triangulifer TaxID=2078957 RepID=UPI00286F8FAE|nr:uncharacterized protein LOC132195152 [Neocloeon triangulifer]XP_059472938.1 uncharacterized protein LOC132195152 [Neocloeon triangulifer]
MDPDNSIGASGISIPNWMKQKIGDRYDLDDSTAFSPPSQDESFFYIRYPKTTSRPPSQTNYHKINQYLESQQQGQTVGSTAAMSTNVPQNPAASTSGFPKSIASQMPAHMNPTLDIEFDPDQPPPNLAPRRGSKSLPASPLSSPKSSRKSLQNRYFTAAFSTPEPNTPGYSGWILSSLLGPREQLPELQLPPISESPAAGAAFPPPPPQASGQQLAVQQQGLRKTKSAIALNDEDEKDGERVKMTPLVAEAKKIQAYKPKPSELRELNFWSPTSM